MNMERKTLPFVYEPSTSSEVKGQNTNTDKNEDKTVDKPVRWKMEAALQFSDPEMVLDYKARDPYDPEVLSILNALMENSNRRILDVGCGSGDLSLLLPHIGEVVHGVDISAPMLEEAKKRAGENSSIQWILGKVEEVSLEGNYGLVTAGDSIHWMDWSVFFPALKRLMNENGVLAILDRFKGRTVWEEEVSAICDHYYTEKDNGNYNVVTELEKRNLFSLIGSAKTQGMKVRRTVESYIHERHSRNGCSRKRLGEARTAEFDQKITEALQPYVNEQGLIEYDIFAGIRWGKVL